MLSRNYLNVTLAPKIGKSGNTLSSTRYLVLVLDINSTYCNLLWKTGVFLNVISGPEVGIGKYVNGKTSLKVRYSTTHY